MRINPTRFNIRSIDYTIKFTPEDILELLRSRYVSETLEKNSFHYRFRKMPNRFLKMSLGYTGVFVPKYEWDKLNYRYGKVTGKKK